MSNFFQGAYEGWSLIYKLRLHNSKLRNRWYSINGYTERKRGVFEIIIDLILQSITEVIKGAYRALFGFRVKKEKFVHSDGTRLQIPTSKNPDSPIDKFIKSHSSDSVYLYDHVSASFNIQREKEKQRKLVYSIYRDQEMLKQNIEHKNFIEWCKDNTGKTFTIDPQYLAHIYFAHDQLRLIIRDKSKPEFILTIAPKVSDRIRNNDFDNKNRLIRIVHKHIEKRNPKPILESSIVDLEPYRPTRLLNRH